jgi:hypothetical protein
MVELHCTRCGEFYEAPEVIAPSTLASVLNGDGQRVFLPICPTCATAQVGAAEAVPGG